LKNKMPFPKPCKKCGKKFQPTGKACKLCDACCAKSKINNGIKRRKRK